MRRADAQIRALFTRTGVEVFPPPGPDRRHSFFAETVPLEQQAGRQYLGIAAQGRSLKVILLRTYLALLAALYLPIPTFAPYRRQIRLLLIGYTLLTIMLWLAFGSRILIGYLNKLNEIALLALLLIAQRRSSSGSRSTNA